MRIGANWTSPRHLPIVRSLLQEGQISFCEILIDNFLHLPPASLQSVFMDSPVAFHIMNSQFIQKDADELKSWAAKLKVLARTLNPMYVSDHLAIFTHQGRHLPLLQEIDYSTQYAEVRERVTLWQNLLETKICFENFPSMLDVGRNQPDFLERLVEETGAGVLFDFSNAVVAHKNCGVPLEAWTPFIRRSERFHVAGYRLTGTDPDLVLDSHDGEVAGDTLGFLYESKARLNGRSDCSIVVERDAGIEKESWSRDIASVRAAFE